LIPKVLLRLNLAKRSQKRSSNKQL